MSNWTPEYKLSINGVEYTSATVANITHAAGRKDIYQQALASYMQVEVLDLQGTNFQFQINDGLTLQVKDSAGNWVVLFGGSITDVTPMVRTSGSSSYTVSWTLIALGALSKLTRIVTDGILSKAKDGDQIYSVLEPLLFNSWNEVPAATTWATYDGAGTTWLQAENSGLGEIDRPGDYELTARSADSVTAYSLVSDLATSGLGYLYEDAQGRICYADSTHRNQQLATYGYTTVSANKANARGLSSTARAGDVRNDVTIYYKNNQSTNAKDNSSIALYGDLASIIGTSLENLTDAQAQAAFYLKIRAYPQKNMSSITFPITNPELTDSERDALLNVYMGQPLELTDLPPAIADGGRFQGFIEGWNFSTGYNNLYLTLYLSPLAYSLQAAKWEDVSGAEIWTTINTGLTWNDATIVAQRRNNGKYD